jgi:hypothetical protein
LHPILDKVLSDLGLVNETPALHAAATFSRAAREKVRDALNDRLGGPGLPLDVAVLGSLARDEASDQSDFDYLPVLYGLLPEGLDLREILLAIDDTRKVLGMHDPGLSGLFGNVVSAVDLAHSIRAEHDTILTRSRRVLFLEESTSVFQPDLHKQLIRAIVADYIALAEGKEGPPRFLLNDMLWYWRTVTIDYEAKRRRSLRSDWGLRYLKLTLSRKLTSAGTLASLLLAERADADYLTSQFIMPSLARLAQLYPHLDDRGRESLRIALVIAESFANFLADADLRREAESVGSLSETPIGSAFDVMRKKSRALQAALEELFFRSSIGPLAQTYLSF